MKARRMVRILSFRTLSLSIKSRDMNSPISSLGRQSPRSICKQLRPVGRVGLFNAWSTAADTTSMYHLVPFEDALLMRLMTVLSNNSPVCRTTGTLYRC